MAKTGLVFARKASGLAKTSSLFDSFAFAFMNNGLGVCIFMNTVFIAFAFPGTDLILAMVSAGIFNFFVLLTWGVLGSAMPRSGGSYVYNSRIIHPVVGLVFSLLEGGVVAISWTYFIPPAYVAQIGMPLIYTLMGWSGGGWYPTPIGIFVTASVVNVLAFVVALFGLKVYNKVQKVCFVIAMAGVTLAFLLLSTQTHASLVALWNNAAAATNSYTWDGLINAVNSQGAAIGYAIPTTWSPWASILVVQQLIVGSVSTAYYTSMIGGEVKRPERNLMLGYELAVLLTIVFFVWAAVVYEQIIGIGMTHALAYATLGPPLQGLQASNMPAGSTTNMYLASLVTSNVALKFLVGFQFIVFAFLWIPMNYFAFSRQLFAWGMDQLAPKWFSDISSRWSSPYKLLVLCFVLGELGIAIYALNPTLLSVIGIIILQCLVWGLGGIACMILPFVGKVKHLWQACPYKWKIGWVPVATIAGAIALFYNAACVYYFFTTTPPSMLSVPWGEIYVGFVFFAIAWYFFWRWKRAKEGINIDLAFRELPPE